MAHTETKFVLGMSSNVQYIRSKLERIFNGGGTYFPRGRNIKLNVKETAEEGDSGSKFYLKRHSRKLLGWDDGMKLL
jgi:hypothetical protein